MLSFTERWRLWLDKQGVAGALLMDLSKAFDTINHELLIAKLHAYGFPIQTLEVLLRYPQERWQRVKINTTFSSWNNYFKEFHKDPFLVSYCLILTSIVFCIKQN